MCNLWKIGHKFDAWPSVTQNDLQGAYNQLAVLSNKFRNGLRRLFLGKFDINLVCHVSIYVLDWCVADNLTTIDSDSTQCNHPRFDKLFSMVDSTQRAIINMAQVFDYSAVSGGAAAPGDDDTCSTTTFEANTLKYMDFQPVETIIVTIALYHEVWDDPQEITLKRTEKFNTKLKPSLRSPSR